jgi:hypothetical protein
LWIEERETISRGLARKLTLTAIAAEPTETEAAPTSYVRT